MTTSLLTGSASEMEKLFIDKVNMLVLDADEQHHSLTVSKN